MEQKNVKAPSKQPLRFVYENNQSMPTKLSLPVIAIELTNGARLSTLHGSVEAVTAEEALTFAKQHGCLPVNLKDFGEVRLRLAEVNQKLNEAASNVSVPLGNIWTFDPATGVMEAYSTRNGVMMQEPNDGCKAALLLKLA